ncbi:hypothetical protein PENSPDRAFT_734918 [Peniophora sp. CONT]|nr:hypothetical protein PENSPDRAFT_734918 [Peniophora sp. CONT]
MWVHEQLGMQWYLKRPRKGLRVGGLRLREGRDDVDWVTRAPVGGAEGADRRYEQRSARDIAWSSQSRGKIIGLQVKRKAKRDVRCSMMVVVVSARTARRRFIPSNPNLGVIHGGCHWFRHFLCVRYYYHTLPKCLARTHIVQGLTHRLKSQ